MKTNLNLMIKKLRLLEVTKYLMVLFEGGRGGQTAVKLTKSLKSYVGPRGVRGLS